MAGPPVSQLNGGNRVKKIKQPFQVFKAYPKVAIPAALVVVLVIGGLVALVLSTGSNATKTATTATQAKKHHKRTKGEEAAKKRHVKRAPIVNGTGTIDVARSVGEYALAQGRGTVKDPTSLAVRVSAAPKQRVTVNYQVSCYRPSGTQFARGQFSTRPPAVHSLPLPIPGADACTVTVGAQLTRNGPGRVKVAVISG